MNRIKPFLRWAGGKNWFTKHIEEFIPTEFNNYYEPFLGGGSIFFFLKSKGLIKNKSYLSDSNEEWDCKEFCVFENVRAEKRSNIL